MPVQIVNAEHNEVDIPESFLANNNGTIVFTGKGGSVHIGEGCHAAQIRVTIGDDCTFRVAEGCRLGAITVHTALNSTVSIGRFTGFTWTCIIQCHESFDVHIGERCLFAGNTWITVSDMHSVVDIASGRRINPGGDVRIGDHVWLGDGAAVLKGCTVGADSVIAARAMVTKDVPPQCVAAGVPARVVRKGVNWDYSLLPVSVDDPLPGDTSPSEDGTLSEDAPPSDDIDAAAPKGSNWVRRLLLAGLGLTATALLLAKDWPMSLALNV